MRGRLAALMGSAAALVATGANAELADVQPSATEVEEVVVRSQRRVERALDVPIQVTALDQKALAEQHILTLEDLQNKVPSVYFGGAGNGTAITIAVRGVGGSVAVFGEEPVAVFADDQFLARGANASDLLDLESIEVLRGPQGTLYGRNATAGAVLLRSNRPSLSAYSGEMRGVWAEHDEQRLEAAVGGPLIDGVLGFRLAGLYSHVGGYYENTARPAEKLGQSESSRMRGALTWAPSDSSSLYVLAEAGKSSGHGANARWSINTNNTIRIPDAQIDSLKAGRFALNSPQHFESEDVRALLSFRHAFDGFELVAEAGYTFTDAKAETDSDGTGANLISNRGRFEDQLYTQDLRLVSTGDGPFRWVAGLSVLQNRFQMPYFYIRNTGAGLDLGFFSNLNTTATAAYAEGTYDWGKLSLTLGARATRETKRAEVDTYFVVLASGFVIDAPVYRAEKTWNNVSPRAVLQYQVSENLNLYASVSRGFKGGGFNAFGQEPSYAPETITAYEIGAKGRLFEGRLQFSAAAFAYDYEDLQIRLGVPQGGVAISSAEGATLKGVEAEATLRPVAGLEMFATVALLDSEYRSFLTPNLAGALVNASGGRLSRAPDVQFGFGAAYQWTFAGDLVARVSASANHIGDVTFTPTDQAARAWSGDAYTEVDARVSVSSPASGWEAAMFLQNATDSFAVTSIAAAGNFPVASFNKPRTFGLELRKKF